MNNSTRLLSGAIFAFLLALGLGLYSSERNVSRLMEDCGSFISRAFGL
jgi:hypothetical protein